MPNEQIKKKKLGRGFWISILVIIVLIPLTVGISWYMGDRKYYIASVLIMIYSMIPFFASFESRKPQARELVTLAVMCAIAVASRAAFVWAENFKHASWHPACMPQIQRRETPVQSPRRSPVR